MEDEKMYTVDEIAEQLRVSRFTILRHIKSGELDAEKIGRQYRIPQTSFNDFRRRARTRKR